MRVEPEQKARKARSTLWMMKRSFSGRKRGTTSEDFQGVVDAVSCRSAFDLLGSFTG